MTRKSPERWNHMFRYMERGFVCCPVNRSWAAANCASDRSAMSAFLTYFEIKIRGAVAALKRLADERAKEVVDLSMRLAESYAVDVFDDFAAEPKVLSESLRAPLVLVGAAEAVRVVSIFCTGVERAAPAWPDLCQPDRLRPRARRPSR
jgi:hypothetical protein